MSTTYDLWKASVQIAEDATTEAEREHHYAVASVLKVDAIKDYFLSIASELTEYAEEFHTPDAMQVSEFLENLDALRAPTKLQQESMAPRALTIALDALKAMEGLNYTGDHTHFEVLADARQVLAAVMMGRPAPKLERFRCMSLYENGVRCQYQLPHDGAHRHVEGGKGVDWTDAESSNPPKSYDTCGDKYTFKRGMLAGKTYTCAREAGHTGQHESKGRSKWA